MTSKLRRAALGLLLCVGLTAVPTTAVAAARPFAPVNAPGPQLTVPQADLAAAVRCTPNATRADRAVALFVPPTALDTGVFAWNWFPALDALDHPYCSVTLPGYALGDIQVSSEYVVHAIRHVHRISGRDIAVVGYSQGGLEPRFAMRFWPDTRAMVSDYVALATPNHGSTVNEATCATGSSCPPSFWQMRSNADFIRAVNSRQETFRGVSYTNVYTVHDQYVTPNQDDSGSTSLRGGGRITNVALQDVCADNRSEHIALGTSDPVAYALVMDALTHQGPARPDRIDDSVCSTPFMPGVDPSTYDEDVAAVDDAIAANIAASPVVTAEPALKPYVFATR